MRGHTAAAHLALTRLQAERALNPKSLPNFCAASRAVAGTAYAGGSRVLQSETIMSTPKLLNEDLDRTDELPVLDVEAYEAKLTSTQHELARTDTWTVEALRDIDELAEAREGKTEFFDVDGGSGLDAGGLTVNVDSILKRIAELEADIVTAHEANDALRKRTDTVLLERDQLHKRVQTLEAENARVNETRDLAKELAERAERKLREQLDAVELEVQALASSRDEARNLADRERAEFSARIAALNAAVDQSQQQLTASEQSVQAAKALAAERAESLMGLEAALNQEKLLRNQLSRQFAAKLTDYDKLASILDLRDQAIEAVVAERDSLQSLLEEARSSAAALNAQIAAAQKRDEASRALLEERTQQLAERDQKIVRLSAAIQELQGSLDDLQARASSSQQQLSHITADHEAQLQRRLELEAQLASRTAELEQARIAAQDARAQLQLAEQSAAATRETLDTERAALEPIRGQLEQRNRELEERESQLQRLSGEIAEVRRSTSVRIAQLTQERDGLLRLPAELQAMRVELEQRVADIEQLQQTVAAAEASAQDQIRELIEQRDELLPIADELVARTSELDAARQETSELREALLSAHSAAQDLKRVLQERTQEFAELDTKVRESAMTIRGLEVAIMARDELAQQLRAELQTARDERVIVTGQLEKARKRVKSLTEEIFKRDHEIAELRTDLGVHSEALAAIRRDVNRIGKDAEVEPAREVEQFLEPVEHSGPVIALTAKMLTIGRTSETDVCLPSKLVSRHHARLLVGPTGVIVEDAGSTNGCFVNGKQVKKHLMHEGDVLELGDLRYRLCTRPTQDTRVRANVVPFDKPVS
jgi:chromosome segregation ATPase